MGKSSEEIAANGSSENNQHGSCKAHHVGIGPDEDRNGTAGTVGEGEGGEEGGLVVLPPLRWLPRLIEALQAPENIASEFFHPTTTSVPVDLVFVVLVENAPDKHPVSVLPSI
jgi:hypothetical protein